MRLFDLIRTANHNLFRNKLRTFLTILAIFVGSLTIILNVAINTGVNDFIDEQTESIGGEDYLTITAAGTMNSMMGGGAMSMGGSEPAKYEENGTIEMLGKSDIAKIKELEGIIADSVQENRLVSVEYITSKAADSKYQIQVGRMIPGQFTIATTAGRLPNRDAKDYEITLQSGYPKALGYGSDEAALGKKVTLVTEDMVTKETKKFEATVVGVIAPGVVTVNESLVSDNLEAAIYKENTKYYTDEQKSSVYALQAQFDNAKYSEDEIKAILEEAGYVGITVSDMMGMIRSFFDAIMIVFMVFGAIALLAAAIGIINTLYMSVEERTREIGLDKALGMSSFKVFLSFAVEAILLGFWGSVLGVAASVGIGYAANYYTHQPGGFLEVFPTFELMKFTPENILPIVGIIMLIALLAGTMPARKAAKKNPIDALRYE